MFDIAPTELLVLGTVALLVIPPKDLPRAMRVAGHWMGKARGVARQFRSGFDTMIRESELAEMEKRWAEENARIMREHSPAQLMADSHSAAPAATDETPAELTEQPALSGAPVPAEPPAETAAAQGQPSPEDEAASHPS